MQRVGQGRGADQFERGVDAVAEQAADQGGDCPSSMTTWSTPTAVSAAALAGLRVVASTVRPSRLARTAVAIPTDDVPPRTSRLWPGRASRPTVREPWAVWSISGTAPRVAQSRVLVNGTTWLAETQVYSAYPPSKTRPMPPIRAMTCWPGRYSPPGQAATVPAASDSEDPGEGHALGQAEPGVQLRAVEAERLDLDQDPPGPGDGDRQRPDLEGVGRSGRVEHHGAHRGGVGVSVIRRLPKLRVG